MNICFVLIEYPVSLVDGKIITDFSGGAGVVMYDIAHGLKKNGHNITILARTITPKHTGCFSDNGIDVYKFFDRNNLSTTQEITDFLKKIIKDKNIDIVETCDYAPLVCEMLENTPLLIRQHTSHGFIRYYENKTETPYDVNNPDCLRHSFELHLADSFAGVSSFIQEKQADFHGFNRNKLYGVIYNGIKEFNINHHSTIDKNLLFCHGTVSKRKGTDRICQIFNEIKGYNPDVKLKIIGNGSDFWQDSCLPLLSRKSKESCIYKKYLSHDEVIQEISSAGIYISMSKLEAMSISMIEAMRLGKPLIVIKNGSFDEFINDGIEGFVVDNEQEAVQKTVELIESNELYEKMSKAAYEKSKLFTIEQCVMNTEKWYKYILKNKKEILSKREIHYSELLKEYYKLITI
jgi:glycosyltransferase involved in cell wall biosynthesis